MSALPGDKTVPKIGLTTAIAIVVANMVGTGIFGSLGFQVAVIPSGFPVLLLWLIGGVISVCGAMCYSELAAMFPRSGGEYQLLNCCWPKIVGFLSGWISVTAGFTAPIALNAVLMGQYLEAITGWHSNWFAVLVVAGVCLIHLGKLNGIAKFQASFTAAKLILIVSLGILGFALGTRQDISFLPRAGDRELILSPEFGISLVFVLYAYAGWNAATYMIDEVRDPKRVVPLAILIGTAIVTAVYLFVNAAFLYSTPIADLAGEPEAGLIASKAILGTKAGNIMGLIIAFGLISTISSMTWAGPRVTYAIGQDYPLFRKFAHLNQNGVPSVAIIFQSLLAVILILSASFEQLLHYIQALLTVSSMAVVVGMMWLRIRHPGLERPFRAWGVPVTPIIFLACTGGILFFQIQQKPLECLWGALTLVIGAAIYYGIVRSSRFCP